MEFNFNIGAAEIIFDCMLDWLDDFVGLTCVRQAYMGVRYYCDRCGSVDDNRMELVGIVICDGDGDYEKLGDLCLDCVEDLKEFIHDGKIDEGYDCFRSDMNCAQMCIFGVICNNRCGLIADIIL